MSQACDSFRSLPLLLPALAYLHSAVAALNYLYPGVAA